MSRGTPGKNGLVFDPEDEYQCEKCNIHWWSLIGFPMVSAPVSPRACDECKKQLEELDNYQRQGDNN